MTRKNRNMIFLALIIYICLPSYLYAKMQNAYYVNMQGVELTENEYQNLAKVFSSNTIASMSKESINLIKSDSTLQSIEETKYYKFIEEVDYFGNVIATDQIEVSQETALYSTFNNFSFSTLAYSGSSGISTYITSMKKITISVVTGVSIAAKYVTITNTWLSLPKIRSYDVIAIRPNSPSFTVSINKDMITGYQKWDGNIVNYDGYSANTKYNSFINAGGQGGVGISMNLVDAATSTIENSMTAVLITYSDPFYVYGSYQHAITNVTLAQSQDYSINSSGMGAVVNFSSNVAPKYDNTTGVQTTWTLMDF